MKRKMEQSDFIKCMYPMDYGDPEYIMMLKYKYDIKVDSTLCKEEMGDSLPENILEQVYDRALELIKKNKETEAWWMAINTEDFKKSDLRYLISKEYLWAYYSTLKSRQYNSFVCSKLNEMFYDKDKENIDSINRSFRSKYRKYKDTLHIKQLTKPDYKVLLHDKQPYAIISYILIKHASWNPVFKRLIMLQSEAERYDEEIDMMLKRSTGAPGQKVRIGDKEFERENIELKVFKILFQILEVVNKKKLPKWEDYTLREKGFLRFIASLSFRTVFNDQFESLGVESKKWENLSEEEQEYYCESLIKEFASYYSEKNERIRKERSYNSSSFSEYRRYFQEVTKSVQEARIHLKKTADLNENSVESKAATYYIAEKIFPLYSIIDYMSLESFQKLMSSEALQSVYEDRYSTFYNFIDAVVSLSRCPNVYAQRAILESVLGDRDNSNGTISKITKKLNEYVKYYSEYYYPALEGTFHMLIEELLEMNPNYRKEDLLQMYPKDTFAEFDDYLDHLLNMQWIKENIQPIGEERFIESFYMAYAEQYQKHAGSYV